MRRLPRVHTIPAGTPFLDTFTAAFFDGSLFDTAPLAPAELASARIFVPTRRAATALTAALASRPGTTLLPAILPLGDSDAVNEALPGGFRTGGAGAQPTIGELDRILELFRLVDAWRAAVARSRDAHGEPFMVAASRADAFALTGDLIRLIDETTIEDVPLSRLATGIPPEYRPERHSDYWASTAQFLRIAAEAYPQFLAERGLVDGAEALKARTRAFARHLLETMPTAPVVIAGSTGSVAATAELMAAVARLPMGAVVLPGFDREVLDEAAWNSIGHADADLPTRFGHPQTILKRTVDKIGVLRADVRRLSPLAAPGPREILLSEIFRPADSTGQWAIAAVDDSLIAAATAGLSLVTAADEREEAIAIALMFREALETAGRSAALVTPDRTLARAVQAELERWSITVADSAGTPLTLMPHAILARLVLRAAAPDAGGIDVLALLRHPLFRMGLGAPERDRIIDAVEIAGLRGRRLRTGVAGLGDLLRAALAVPVSHRDPAPRQRIDTTILDAVLPFVGQLGAAFGPFSAVVAARPTLRAMAAAHRGLVEVLIATGPDEAGVLLGDDGEALAAIFETIALARDDGPEVGLTEYAQIFDDMLQGEVVRPRRPGHPRLKIWGLLEARLLDADRIILAGLDEGTWPPETRGDPFLNRPMRIALGLQPPERRIGQTAHDFMTLLGAPDVVITRAAKRAGSPTIASRFLRRLTAFAGEEATQQMALRGRQVIDWARALDLPATTTPALPPAPRPPAELMPGRLSLTEVETLYRDPYTVFARRVLKLDPLDPVDPPLDARERGTIVHEALARYTSRHPQHVPQDAAMQLRAIGDEAFAALKLTDPEAVQFWWQRFDAFIPWFLDWDGRRRHSIAELHSELPGSLGLDLPGGHTLTLSTRADRIERGTDGSVAIIDYKTGTPPSAKEVMRGLAPQLPLTAALIARGAFKALGPLSLSGGVDLRYLQAAMARGAGKDCPIKPEKEPIEDVIEKQFVELKAYLTRLMSGAQPYQSRRIPKKKSYSSDYDHLARHLEWSLGGDDEGNGHE